MLRSNIDSVDIMSEPQAHLEGGLEHIRSYGEDFLTQVSKILAHLYAAIYSAIGIIRRSLD